MLIQFPTLFNVSLQALVLTLNTVLILGILIVTELVYAERPAEERRKLRPFYPIVAVVVGLLVLAIIKQIGRS